MSPPSELDLAIQNIEEEKNDDVPIGWDTFNEESGARWSAWVLLDSDALGAKVIDAQSPSTDTPGYPSWLLRYLRQLCVIEMKNLGAQELRAHGTITWYPDAELTRIVTRVVYFKNNVRKLYERELFVLNISNRCL